MCLLPVTLRAMDVQGMPPQRRRGEVLMDAVFSATLAEIAEHGLRGASMDRIARRAGTGKATLYRRWPNVRALALDVFLTTITNALPTEYPNTGRLRDDLITSLTQFTEALNGPLGLVLRELIGEAAHDPSVSEEFTERYGLPQQLELVAAAQRAMARGEIPAQAIDPLVLQLPAAFVLQRILLTGTPPTTEDAAHLIDAVIMPLLSARQ